MLLSRDPSSALKVITKVVTLNLLHLMETLGEKLSI